MYKLSDKESPYIYINCSSPCSWLALSNKSGNDVTDALVKRAYAAVSCRNPLLRAVHKPEVEKFSLVIKEVEEIIQDEKDGKLPAHLTKEFHTREEAWAEYKKRIEEGGIWKSKFMWEVIVCVLDKESPSNDTNCVVFGYFNHGVTDGAAVMVALSEFVRVLNAGLETSNTLPPHNFLGESLSIPKPFLERYPLYKFDDPMGDEEKEDLFVKANTKFNTEERKLRGTVVDKMLTEEATKSFIAKCKKYGVSVTAGFYAAVAIVTSAKKINSGIPISYRTKDDLNEISVSFTSTSLTVDLTSALASVEGKDEETTWAAVAKEVHKEIRKKLESPVDKYRGTAFSFLHSILGGVKTSDDSSILKGANSDELSFSLSNVGILDKYFVDDGPLTVMDVTGYCANYISQVFVFWCYTFRGRFRFATIDIAYTPRREAFEEFVNEVIKFIEKK